MRCMKLWIEETRIKNKDQFLRFLDSVCSKDFVEIYDAKSILNYFEKLEAKA